MIEKSKKTSKNGKSHQNMSAKIDFAASMQELEEITAYLQSDDVDINTAVEKFKRGQQLTSDLKLFLEETENSIAEIKLKTKK